MHCKFATNEESASHCILSKMYLFLFFIKFSLLNISQDQVGVSQQEAVASATAQLVDAQTRNQYQVAICPTSPSELSPTSVTQSISSLPSPTLLEQRLSPVKVNDECTPKTDLQVSSDLKPISSVPVVKTPSSDGYNWRKYGQKQVKSPKGSRSYYKCTFSDCCAKKIECSDHSGRVIEIVYKSQHSHDPPRKFNCTKENKLASSAEIVVANSVTEHPIQMLNKSEAPTASKETIQETPLISERKRQNSSDSNGNCETKIKEEHVNGPEPKRRQGFLEFGFIGFWFIYDAIILYFCGKDL